MDIKRILQNIFAVIICFQLLTSTLWAKPSTVMTEWSETEIMERLSSMSTLVEAKETKVIMEYLERYLVKYPAYTQKLIGKRVLFFPLFEEIFAANDLPDDLKYLSIVESSLRPGARSRVGAMGLWQFMPATGRICGLRINNQVDERKDPIRSTEAAAEHLQKLYEYFGDWALVLAAYNSGAGNVNRAIRRAGSSDYWDIRPYLPKETRDYIPAYLAATYLFKNYEKHNLQQELPGLDFQVTEYMKVYQTLSFKKIQELTGLEMAVIRDLNPGFKRDIIPESHEGFYLTLPKRVISIVKYHLLNPDHGMEEIQTGSETEYVSIELQAFAGESLQEIADHFKINLYNIQYWNNLQDNTLRDDRELLLFVVQETDKKVEVNFRSRELYPGISQLPRLQLEDVLFITYSLNPEGKIPMSEIAEVRSVPGFSNRKRYVLQKGETVKDILEKFPSLTLTELMTRNNLTTFSEVKTGTALIIE